ncbi:MAG: hypothetical protein KGL39_16385 [Patescibacteria group bacterium]|nr:hypothetical protein [Patescibacteria group bacterium]
MRIRADTLYDAWVRLNQKFLDKPEDDAWLIPGRDFTNTRYNVQLHGEHGFQMPLVAPWWQKERRITLLEKRYIDPDLWDEGVNRLIERRDHMAGSQPGNFSIMFHRRPTKERKVPSGGGCLISINFTWFKGRWNLHVLSRASEITYRLLADMYFLQYSVERAVAESNLKKWNPDDFTIDWTLLLPSQMKSMAPIFLQHVGGDEAVRRYMTWLPLHDWQRTVQAHFWGEFIYPEKITWAQRRKWSNLFFDETKADWRGHRWAGGGYPYPIIKKRDLARGVPEPNLPY